MLSSARPGPAFPLPAGDNTGIWEQGERAFVRYFLSWKGTKTWVVMKRISVMEVFILTVSMC